MQMIIGQLVVAVIAAIAILATIIILGASIWQREKIERTNAGYYARVIVTPILLLITAYLYIQGQLNSDIFLVAIFSLVPIIFCTDWTKLERKEKSENGPEIPNEY